MARCLCAAQLGSRVGRLLVGWLLVGLIGLIGLLVGGAAPAFAAPAVTKGSAASAPAELLCARGIARYRQGDLPGAISLLSRAWKQDDAPAAAGHYLGLALLRQGKVKAGRRALSAAARRAPKNARLLIDLAQAYLIEDNAAWAVRTLQRAKQLTPDNTEIDYHLGVALLRLGQAKQAARRLEQAKGAAGVDANELRLQHALALYLDQRWERARGRLAGLLSGPRASLARQLLRASYEAQGTPAALVSATVSLGAVADTNPLYEHETTAPLGLGPSLAASLVVRPWVDTRNLIWGEASAQRVQYFAAGTIGGGTDPRDGSFTDLRAGVFYARRLPSAKRELQLSVGYRFGITLLDGDPPLADENHIFAESHGGVVALSVGDGAGTSTQLRLAISRNVFAVVARSSVSNELWLEHSRPLASKLRLLAWITGRQDAAQAARYDAFGVGAGAGLSWLAPWRLIFGLRAAYRLTDFLASGVAYSATPNRPVASSPLARLDHNIDLMAEVGRPLFWGLRLRLVYRYLRNVSTVTSFDYDRHLTTLDVTWAG
jgi:tetratricopeptide (TPR) repeat protein